MTIDQDLELLLPPEEFEAPPLEELGSDGDNTPPTTMPPTTEPPGSGGH